VKVVEGVEGVRYVGETLRYEEARFSRGSARG
jgi:hypothetical protein